MTFNQYSDNQYGYVAKANNCNPSDITLVAHNCIIESVECIPQVEGFVIFKPGARRPHAWFLEITFTAQVYACVCVYAPEAINN